MLVYSLRIKSKWFIVFILNVAEQIFNKKDTKQPQQRTFNSLITASTTLICE